MSHDYPRAAEAVIDETDITREEAQTLELRLRHVEQRLARQVKLLEGNGTPGLLGQVLTNSERIAVLGGQWKWTAAVLAGFVAAALQAILMR